ncbi:MAG: 4-hydroxy-tetrahydrodipicolinate reductase [Paramuribaculum sp.]|nr:4-hydroxy-tetrahydrodipicolinate reductase [Paramuribaculum sp.]
MKLALIGYGKMGHAIEQIALNRGHEIVAVIDINNPQDFNSPEFASADVAIEFTTPATAVNNYLSAFKAGVPVVSGTTAWTEKMPMIKDMCANHGATFFWTSNFSIGVNIFFALNNYLASIMAKEPQYSPAITEIHHIHKLDHPSGTAITLAEGIINNHPEVTSWTENDTPAQQQLPISHKREGEVPGTHIITWDSPVDTITIEHKAKSRQGFALGAVMAAEWVKDRKGFLTMDMMMHDILSPVIDSK